MTHKNDPRWGLLLFALAVAAGNARAQSIYTPYAFTNFAGLPGVSGIDDGYRTNALFNMPGSIVVDQAGTFYIADFGNHTIRKLTSDGMVTTFAGLAGVPGSDDGTGPDARFYNPAVLDIDTNGNLYLSDFNNHTIRQVTPAGVVTTLAGTPGVPGTNDGPAGSALFNHPLGVAVDNATNVYVGDYGNYTIRKITPDGQVTTLAGAPGVAGTNDGPGNVARFNGPHYVRVDRVGNLYVADSESHTIRKVTPAGVVTTLAGSAGNQGSQDGIGCEALFGGPIGVGLDHAGNILVMDWDNNCISQGTAVLQFDSAVGLSVSNALVKMWLLGPSGSNVVVEASPDLVNWTPVRTNSLPVGGLSVSVPLGTGRSQLFRARMAP